MCCSHSLISQKCPQQYSPTLTWPTSGLLSVLLSPQKILPKQELAQCILRSKNGECCLIHYASRSLSETEKLYAVIKKEALAVTWASEKFSD